MGLESGHRFTRMQTDLSMDEWCFDELSDYEFVPRAELRSAANKNEIDWKHPPWVALRGVIVGTLENFDDARRAVVAAIRKWEEDCSVSE